MYPATAFVPTSARARRWLRRLALALVACLAAACGSALDDARLEAAQGTSTARAQRAAATGDDGEQLGPVGAVADGSTSARGGDVGGGAAAGPGGARTAGGGRGGGSGPAAPSGKKPIVLGTFGTASGVVGAQVASIPVAVRAWAASVNARGGIAGRPVRVIFGGDDGGDPGRAQAIVRRLVEEEKVIALVGTYGGVTGPAIVPYVEEHRVPVVGSIAANQAEDNSPMFFNPHNSSMLGINRNMVIGLTKLSSARKAALVYCRESEACTGGARPVRDYAPVLGVELVAESQVSLAQPDFTAEMIQARNAEAEAVFAIMDYNSFIRMVRSAHRQGWRPQFVCAVPCNEEGFKAGVPEVEGVIAQGSVAPYSVSARMQDYVAAVHRYVPGGAIGGTGAAAWVQGKLIERVVELLPDDPTREHFLGALWSLRGETLGGRVPPLTFPQGSHLRVNLCAVPIQFKGGKFVAPLGEQFFCGTDSGARPAPQG